MGVIKSVLQEELENFIRMKEEYKRALAEYPGGSYVKKKIRGHFYYYLAFRHGKKVRFIYKGKVLSKEDIANLKKSKKMRLKYKELIKKLTNRIKFIKRALRGRE